MGIISRESVEKKLGLGKERLGTAGEDPDALALALTTIHGALEDFLRLWLGKHPHVPEEVRSAAADRGVTNWRDLQLYLSEYAEESSVVRQLRDSIPVWNRARQEVAHGGEYDGTRLELEVYARLVASAITGGIGYRQGIAQVGEVRRPSDSFREEQLREQKVARLDREWRLERESYMVRGNNGRRERPSRLMGAYLCVFGPAFGTIWVAFNSHFENGSGFHDDAVVLKFFPIIGPVAAVICIAYGIYVIGRANAYRQAEQRYMEQREALLTGRR